LTCVFVTDSLHLAGKSCLVDRYINRYEVCKSLITGNWTSFLFLSIPPLVTNSDLYSRCGLHSTFEAQPKNTIGAAFAAKKVELFMATCLQASFPCSMFQVKLGPHNPQNEVRVSESNGGMQIRVHSGRVVSLGIWDTAGAERFESLSRMYYNGAKAAVLCFDPCNAKSFEKLKFWVRVMLPIIQCADGLDGSFHLHGITAVLP
jgi:GTPase SAR1 family protein